MDRLVDAEREALIRLGRLAASGSIDVLFDAMAEELAHITDAETGETFTVGSGVCRFEADGALTLLAGWGRVVDDSHPIGISLPLHGDSANRRVYETGRPARMDGPRDDVGPIAERLNKIDARSVVAVPIFVDDRLWGSATVVSERARPLPANTETRLAGFAALAATAISSAQHREQVQRLADEQSALRRVATLVAAGAKPEDVWASVLAELGVLCRASRSAMIRFDPPDVVTIVAGWSADGAPESISARWPLSESGLSLLIDGQRPVVRIDDWSRMGGELAETLRARWSVNTSVMAPVLTGGGIWGGVVVHSPTGIVLPQDTERRVVAFAELVSTALANAAAGAEVRRLADEQATVRRIATLVAQQAPVPDVCQAVTDELIALLPVEDVVICRYEGDGTAVILGRRGMLAALHPVGLRGRVDPDTAAGQVCEQRRTVRVDSYVEAVSVSGQAVREAGARSTVACPIFAGGRYWGWLSVTSAQSGRVPDLVVQPVTDCIDLIATSIRNVETEDNLRASRERIVTATDEARRRFERDLHDGAQQRLVSLALELRLGAPDFAAAADEIDSILDDLRDLSRGLHPAVLAEGDLPAALRALSARSPVPVELTLPPHWPGVDDSVQVACYYVAAEALTNVAKHARATAADVTLAVHETSLTLTITDDGAGGADRTRGSGLVGIIDRVEAFGGSLTVDSPPGQGTTLVATLPTARASAGRTTGG
ncbi:GAF domain-containing protein [Actinoplanes sp. Pm04-4]|uniref:histidine kinase n=1 Tax=Paractinoplanes pyxinae TaxID=2997416 RepID=A0ABT4BCH3_9ACTN|nr:GAF domain-containing protein [Actinoplanes pyxinae]MCY1144215.1 GAF domain-containing protein [Actinoplanes pyxinae]